VVSSLSRLTEAAEPDRNQSCCASPSFSEQSYRCFPPGLTGVWSSGFSFVLVGFWVFLECVEEYALEGLQVQGDQQS